MGRCLERRERQESGPRALAHFCRLSHLEARLISAQYCPVIQLFSCVPGSAFHFPSQCPKLYAPTQGSMLNILGSRPKFYSLLQTPHTHHHLPPLLLPGSLVVGQAEEIPLHPGEGADTDSLPSKLARVASHLAAVLSAEIQDLSRLSPCSATS